jgi:tRNA-2-methylthio-N6-dimethylallyladenosine synthase
MRRFRVIEELQKEISTEINTAYSGQEVPVLFESRNRGRWRGRTPTNKIVFAESEENIKGKVRPVHITWTGPWSLVGTAVKG